MVSERVSDLIMHSICDEDLPEFIADEVEKSIAKSWNNGVLRNRIEEMLTESFSHDEFMETLNLKFVKN